MTDLNKFREEQLRDPEFQAYYHEMQPLADISKSLIAARMEKNLTQKELSKLTGISQADISRIESCDASPSLRTLQKLAKGLDMQVKIEFIPC